MAAGVKTPALNPSEGQKESRFTLFTFLPTEIRLKIWQHSFLPRRVDLARHSSQPALDKQSGALLLVNREANQVFLETYALCFLDGGLDGIYFNYALDTLCLTMEFLRPLVDEYPGQMAKVQCLEILPQGLNSPEWIPDELKKMPSLRLITIRSSSGYEWEPWQGLERFEVQRRLYKIWDILDLLGNSLRQLPPNQRPTLSTIFSPLEVDLGQLLFVCETTADVEGLLSLKEPSNETEDSFETDIPKRWLSIWPGRNHLKENGWFAYEVE